MWPVERSPVKGNHHAFKLRGGRARPKLVTTTFPEVKAAEMVSAYEGYVQVGIGLDHVSSYTVTVLSPTELAIDVAH
jgi:hypothetical protein